MPHKVFHIQLLPPLHQNHAESPRCLTCCCSPPLSMFGVQSRVSNIAAALAPHLSFALAHRQLLLLPHGSCLAAGQPWSPASFAKGTPPFCSFSLGSSLPIPQAFWLPVFGTLMLRLAACSSRLSTRQTLSCLESLANLL